MTTTIVPVTPRTRRNLPLLWTLARSPRAVWRFFTKKNGAWGARLAVLFAFVYVVVPVDLIPDIAPIIGWLDDVGLATAAIGWMTSHVLEEVRLSEASDQADSTADLTSS